MKIIGGHNEKKQYKKKRKGRIEKIVGNISDEIIEKYQLYDYRNTEIVQSFDLYKHITKHMYEFKSIDSYNKTITNIPLIISEPDFVYYYLNRNSLQYFKEIDENVYVVVKLNLKKNKKIILRPYIL